MDRDALRVPHTQKRVQCIERGAPSRTLETRKPIPCRSEGHHKPPRGTGPGPYTNRNSAKTIDPWHASHCCPGTLGLHPAYAVHHVVETCRHLCRLLNVETRGPEGWRHWGQVCERVMQWARLAPPGAFVCGDWSSCLSPGHLWRSPQGLGKVENKAVQSLMTFREHTEATFCQLSPGQSALVAGTSAAGSRLLSPAQLGP